MRVYYGWWVAAAGAGIQFANAATAIGILTVFVIPMSQEFGWNRTEMAGATSLGAILGAILAPFSGSLVDRFGARIILVVGGFVVVLGCLYLSTAQTLFGLLRRIHPGKNFRSGTDSDRCFGYCEQMVLEVSGQGYRIGIIRWLPGHSRSSANGAAGHW